MKFCYTANTFQGEGLHIGTPVDIIRVVGCSVGCRFCDESPESPVEYVSGMLSYLRGGSSRSILLTGGEPLQQLTAGLVADITQESLADRLPILMVETSGVGDWALLHGMFAAIRKRTKNVLVLSPKKVDVTPLRPKLLQEVNELVVKYLWSERNRRFVAKADILTPYWSDFSGHAALVVQPVDSGQVYENLESLGDWYRKNMDDIENCLRDDVTYSIIRDKYREVYRVLPQLHKILNMP